jgi:TfoX/Sxy family transcriptional regulator of competence genes
MATSAQTIAHLLDQLPGGMTAKKMFGEYALYLGDRVVAFVCDDTLFIKPTPGARALLPAAEMAPAYPGSKDYIVASDALDDADLMARVVQMVASETPAPKPKKAKPR